MTDDIAIVHKHYPERGGAEVVADELARTFDAPVYCGVADPDATAADVDVTELFGDSLLAPLMRRPSMPWQALRDLYYVVGWDHQPALADYDVLVESGMAPFWYVPEDDQTVVRYVHSPPRMPYDRYQAVGDSRLVRWYSRAARVLLQHTVPYADGYVANSELVARRLARYLGVAADAITVVYPPVDVGAYDPQPGGDYYVALGRLAGGKGWPFVIRSFRSLDRELRIVGDGPRRDDLERQAADCDNIQFLGYVDEERKRELLAGAAALVYAAHNEDFGLVPIEAMAAGTPVLGVAEGYTQYQIQDGKSGYTVAREGGHLRERVRYFERHGVAWWAADLHAFARRFGRDRFREEMREVVGRAREQARVAVPWADADAPAAARDGRPTASDRGEPG